MANILKVRVSKVSSKATSNGNFIHTLKTEGKTASLLGQQKTAGVLTYFVALPAPTAVGTEHEIDMDQFSITERPMEVPVQGGAPGEVETLMLKWLSVK